MLQTYQRHHFFKAGSYNPYNCHHFLGGRVLKTPILVGFSGRALAACKRRGLRAKTRILHATTTTTAAAAATTTTDDGL